MNPATAYVGNYTYTLDDLASSAKKRYLMAVQSGKPVLDEELSEIGFRSFDFLRRYLEQNVGDAVVDGDRTAVLESDPIPGRTWRVEESIVSNVNNFVVKGGTSDKPAILVVKGFPILLFSDIEYNQQDNSGSLEDDDFTNTTIPALSPPVAGVRTDSVYVDIYFAEVSSEVGSEYQDTSLEDPTLGLQTANRFRIVQDILVAEGTTSIPADGADANGVYHRYYKLAEISRTAGVNAITSLDITDERTYVNSLENLSNGQGELNVFNAFVQNDLTVHGTMTIINQTETNQEKLVITTNDAGVDALVINKSNTGRALVVNKEDAGYAIEVNDTGSDDAMVINKTGSGYAINIQSGSMLLDNDTDLFYSPSIEGVNSLKTHIENQLELHEPTGFPNRTDTTFSFVNGTRQFTISPTGSEFSFFVNNTKFTKNSAESVVISDAEGIHFIYYDNTGTLVTSQTPWDFTANAPVAYIHWDAANDEAIVIAEERHGTIMDGQTHTYLHQTIGSRYVGGFGLTGNDSGSGNDDTDAQVAISDGTIYDEDIAVTIFNGVGSAFFEQQLSPIAYIPIFYRIGASGYWRKLTADTFPVYDSVGTGRLGWNELSGSWQVSEVPNDNYIPMFIFATNDTVDPIIAILGQSVHSTFLDAQNNSSYQALAFGDIPFQEMKILYRLIFQTNDSYSNTVKAKLVNIQDLRSITNVPSGTYIATDHGSLSGLSDQDHPATAIFTNFSNFNGGLTATDTSVQIALDTLDDIWVRLSPSSPNTDDLYRMGDVILGTNTASVDAKLLVADTFGSKHIAKIQALGTPPALGDYGGQLFLTADTRSVKLASVVETNIGSESWGTYPRVGLQIETVNPGGQSYALRITHDGRFGFGTTTVTAGYRAEVSGNLYVTGNNVTDGTLTQNGVATFNNSLNLSTQTADRIALIDASKNVVSSTVTLAELQVLDDFVENVQDIVGGMVSGNTENGISVTYDDPSGKLNFDVNDPVLTIAGGASGSSTMTNLSNTTITVVLNTEDVQDIVGAMVSGNTENGLSVTYDDGSGKLNFDVNDPTITLNGDVSGSAVMTNLGNTTITVDIVNEVIEDMVGAMVSGNTENGITVFYNDTTGKLDFDVDDFTITLTGDVSGSGTVTDLANVSISVAVANDSHSHSNSTITSVDWSKLSNVPDPVITLNGDCSGSGTMTNLGSTTITVTVANDSHSHSNSTISSVDWSKLSNVPDPTITLSGDCSGAGTMTNLGSTTISVTVANDSHTHDGRYYTESQSDDRFVNVSGDTMTGTLTLAIAGLKFPDDPFGGSGDTAGFRLLQENTEDMIWEFYIANDAADRIRFSHDGSTYFEIGGSVGVRVYNTLNLDHNTINDVATLSFNSGGTYTSVNFNDEITRMVTAANSYQVHIASGLSMGYPYQGDGAYVSIYGNNNSHRTGELHLHSGTAGNIDIDAHGNDIILSGENISIYGSLNVSVGSDITSILLQDEITRVYTDANDAQIHFASGLSMGYPSQSAGAFISIYGNTNTHRLGELHLGSGTAGGIDINSYGGHLVLDTGSSSYYVQVEAHLEVNDTAQFNPNGGDVKINCESDGRLHVYVAGSNYGGKIGFGDSDYVYLKEASDDALTIHADEIILDADHGDGVQIYRTSGTNKRALDVSAAGSGSYAVYADASGGWGIFGRSTLAGGVGINGACNGSGGTNIGVRGAATNGTTNYAFYAASGTYGSFTGAHDTVVIDDVSKYEMGMIVTTNGTAYKRPNSVMDSIPCIRLSDTSNDICVFGIFAQRIGKFVSNSGEEEDWRDNFIAGKYYTIINSIGEGQVLVTNYNGNIANGDYITTSPILGLGMKQDDDLLHNYTVAKAIEEINWDDIIETIEHNGKVYKKTLIACTYHCG